MFEGTDNVTIDPANRHLHGRYKDGPYRWTATVKDVAGNTTTRFDSVVVDNFKPTPEDLTVENAHFFWDENEDQTGLRMISELSAEAGRYLASDTASREEGPYQAIASGIIRRDEPVRVGFSTQSPIRPKVTVRSDTFSLEPSPLPVEALVNSSGDREERFFNYRYGRDIPQEALDLNDRPTSATFTVRGRDYANNRLDGNPGQFSRRDLATGNFQNIPDKHSFTLEVFFDYVDPSIVDIEPSTSDSWDLDVTVSDMTNSDHEPTNQSQDGTLTIEWFFNIDKWVTKRLTVNDLPMDGSNITRTIELNHDASDFDRVFVIATIVDAAGNRSVTFREGVRNSPVKIRRTDSPPMSFNRLELVKKKNRQVTDQSDVKPSFDSYRSSSSDTLVSQALYTFKHPHKATRHKVRVNHYPSRSVPRYLGTSDSVDFNHPDRPQDNRPAEGKEDVNDDNEVETGTVEISAPSSGPLESSKFDVRTNVTDSVDKIILEMRSNNSGDYQVIRRRGVPRFGNEVTFRNIKMSQRTGEVELRVRGVIRSRNQTIQTSYSDVVRLKRSDLGGVSLTDQLQQRLSRNQVKSYAVDPGFGAMYISGPGNMTDQPGDDPAFDPSDGEFLAVAHPNMKSGEVVVHTVSGEQVYREQLDPGSTRLEWRGRNEVGQLLNNGAYIVRVKVTVDKPGSPPRTTAKSFPVMVVK